MSGYESLAARTAERVQVRVLTAQLQPVPLKSVTVRPVGGFSVTVTVEPSVAPSPAFVTDKVYVSPLSPWRKVPLWLLVISRAGFCTIVVGSSSSDHGLVAQPRPSTSALLVTFAAAFLLTSTVAAMTWSLSLQAGLPVRVQVRVLTAQLQPVPLRSVTVRSVGGFSVTVTV